VTRPRRRQYDRVPTPSADRPRRQGTSKPQAHARLRRLGAGPNHCATAQRGVAESTANSRPLPNGTNLSSAERLAIARTVPRQGRVQRRPRRPRIRRSLCRDPGAQATAATPTARSRFHEHAELSAPDREQQTSPLVRIQQGWATLLLLVREQLQLSDQSLGMRG
jgi:hypothetical protein